MFYFVGICAEVLRKIKKLSETRYMLKITQIYMFGSSVKYCLSDAFLNGKSSVVPRSKCLVGKSEGTKFFRGATNIVIKL